MLNFFKKIVSQVSGKVPDWDEIELQLMQSDFGAKFTTEFIEELKKKESFWANTNAEELTRKEISQALAVVKPVSLQKPVHVVLLVGVNGVGKTTSAAKLAYYYQRNGLQVRLVAGDTFRAAAIEQLITWGNRLNIPVTFGEYGSDSSALAYSGYQTAEKEKSDVLIIDTAGRQHTKANLMQELAKMIRVIKKICPSAPHETLLVIDANTGCNALNQAKEFQKLLPLTGIVASKLDGSGTGGSLVAISKECQLRPQWMGLGEKVEDFVPFDKERYLEKLLGRD